jgi:hypothetical protein
MIFYDLYYDYYLQNSTLQIFQIVSFVDNIDKIDNIDDEMNVNSDETLFLTLIL